MKRSVLASAAMAVVLMVNVVFSVDAHATSRTTTTELGGAGRTVEEAVNFDPQVLGARRSATNSENVTSTDITDESVLATISKPESFETLISEYAHAEVEANELTVLDSMDVSAQPGVEVSEKNPLYVSFSFPGITAKSEAYILHLSKAGWEVVPTTVSEGKVTGKFTSLSPVAIVAKKATLNGSVLGASRKTSPRTGDNFWLIVIAGLSVIAVSATVLQKKFSNV